MCAKLVAPLMSLDARGKIGDAVVFSGWKGVQYARKFFVPANPDTVPQQTVRNRVTVSAAAWKVLSAPNRALWVAEAEGIAQTGTSLFMKGHINYMRDNAEASPAAPYLPS